MADSGDVVFHASLAGADPSTDLGIWAGTAGDLRLVAREGDEAPGVPGQVYTSLGAGARINPLGQVAFDGAIDSGQNGIWAEVADRLVLVVLEGHEIELAPGDFRTIRNLSSPEFNGRREIAFWAEFTDFSQAIVVASFDPTSLLAMLMDAVVELDLRPGAANPLLDKLSNAITKLENDNSNDDSAAVSLVSDFIAIVEAKIGKFIDPSDAEELIAAAEQIIALLEGE
jgi:hypothetical protein